MSKRFVSLPASAALILAALAISARAEEPVAVHGVKTVGALTLESRGLALSARDVIRQGGLATAGVRWEPVPALAKPEAAIHGVKTVGAMSLESRGLAASPRDVIRQGGLAVAGTVRWTPTPAPAEVTTASVTGAGTVGALRLETLGLATSASGVLRQGGAASARAVRWTSTPAQ